MCEQIQKKKPQSAYTYKPQRGVVVICSSEEEQRQVYERLRAEGLILKIVNV